MGTTVAGALVRQERLTWFNVGDSRVYRYRENRLRQLSIDDVPTTARSERKLHRITQAIGGISQFADIEPHIGTEPLDLFGVRFIDGEWGTGLVAILLALVSLSFHSLLLKRQLLVVMVAFEALVPPRRTAQAREEEAPVLRPATEIR